ncbi:MAG: DUF3021 domain-containing protein [Clostridia bacterium]|nr:DUF3021 domain-containing protein [Clostridia bacterium]
MKKIIKEFIHKGCCACGLGPLVLAVVYLILQKIGVADMLSVNEVCTGIISLLVLAFIAGGMNAVYRIERLPLMVAILIHGSVLYFGYLATYIINGWLEAGTAPILVFSAIFVIGYLIIWAFIYLTMKKRTAQVNEMLKKNQCTAKED